MILPEQQISLASHTTLKVGGKAEYYSVIRSRVDLEHALAFARDTQMPFFVLGGGSNVLIADEGFQGLVIHMQLLGKEWREEGEEILAVVSAGEEWDLFVKESVERGFYDLANLSGIPGTVGAAPIQNIGAYGSEVSQTIQWVEVCNTETREIEKLSKEACNFAYRHSVFKTPEGKKYIVLKVAFLLKEKEKPNLTYKDLKAYFEERCAVHPSPSELRHAVLSIREGKFPDWTKLGTAGSFFKNPSISKAHYTKLKTQYPDMPAYVLDTGDIKVPLAWILDHVCHLKGYREDNVGLFEKQPLILVNYDEASANEIQNFAHTIAEKVKEKINIEIEWEVQHIQ